MASTTTTQRSLPFDQRDVFDRLPLSEEQKLALMKRLISEKTETPDQCCTEMKGNDDLPGAVCAVDCHDHHPENASSSHQMDPAEG